MPFANVVVSTGRASSIAEGGAVTFGQAQTYGGQFSMAPAVSRLSDTSFVIAYFDNKDDGGPVVMVRYGKRPVCVCRGCAVPRWHGMSDSHGHVWYRQERWTPPPWL